MSATILPLASFRARRAGTVALTELASIHGEVLDALGDLPPDCPVRGAAGRLLFQALRLQAVAALLADTGRDGAP